VVEVAEVGHDDGHRQRDGEHAGYGAHRAHQLAPHRLRGHVPVAHRGHGDHRPPEGVRDADEVRVFVVGLGKVDGAGEEDDADEEEEDEQAQLAHAGPQCLTEDLEALRVARQLEDPEHPHQPDDSDDGQRRGRSGVVGLGQLGSQSDEKGQDGAEVDDVHDILEEVRLAGRASEAHEELEGEPADADGLHQEEGVLENTLWEGHVLRYVLCLRVVLVKIFLKLRRQERKILNIIVKYRRSITRTRLTIQNHNCHFVNVLQTLNNLKG